MQKQHWIVVGAFFGGLGLAISGLHDWREALAPAFVGGVFVQAAAVVRAIFVDKPEKAERRRWDLED